MNIKEHIEANHYPRDDKGRALVPTRKGGLATILSADLGRYIIAFYDGCPREWREDGEYWGRFDNCRDELHRRYDLLPPPPRKVKVTRYVVILSSGGSGYFYSTPALARDQWGDQLDGGHGHLVELTGEYEEPWQP